MLAFVVVWEDPHCEIHEVWWPWERALEVWSAWDRTELNCVVLTELFPRLLFCTSVLGCGLLRNHFLPLVGEDPAYRFLPGPPEHSSHHVASRASYELPLAPPEFGLCPAGLS